MGLRQLHRGQVHGLSGPVARLGAISGGSPVQIGGRAHPMILRLLRCAALALTIALASLPARADDLAAVVAGLAGDSFAAKEQAIVALGKLGDPRAVPILQALSDDRLRRALDGRVVLVLAAGDTTRLTDAASGQELRDVAPDSLGRIIVNNILNRVRAATACG